MGKDKYGDLRYTGLKNQLDTNSNNGAELEEDDGEFYVRFITSRRVYEVDRNGNVTYLGEESELLTQATITASPESNTTPQYVQIVDLTLKTGVVLSSDDVTLKYCWSLDNQDEPTEGYTVANISSNGGRKWTATGITSIYTDDNDNYLWAKAIVNGKEFTKCFGPYAIKEHTTLMYIGGTSATYTGSDAAFLGNSYGVTRGYIQDITFTNSFTDSDGITHTLSDDNCWDVSANSEGNKNGKVLAWYEPVDVDGITYYDVTIAEEGGVIANANSSYLFSNIGASVTGTVTINGLQYLDTSSVTSMAWMFYNCSSLTSLDVSGFDTSNVTNMSYMFRGCSSLTVLDVNGFNTRNVTNMNAMFNNCSGLTSLDVSGFDTSNVTNMSWMFRVCTSLTSLDVSGFNTSKVTTMSNMFYNCSKVTSLDVSGFNTSNVTNMGSMFYSCSGLTSLDVSGFNTSNVTNMGSMFSSCSGITSLDVSGFNTSKVTSMSNMFYNCSKVTSLDVSGFDTSKVTTMSRMFNNCSSLTSLDVSNFDTGNVTTVPYMFTNCSGLTNLAVSNWNLSNATTIAGIFSGCKSLTEININDWDISKITELCSPEGYAYGGLFQDCSSLTKINLSKWSTINVSTFHNMFKGCTNLQEINIDNFDPSNISIYTGMFTNVPTTIQITTNSTMKTWLETNFADWAGNITLTTE